MRQGARVAVAVLAVVLGLHVFMLAGLDDRDAMMPPGGVMGMAAAGSAGSVAEPTATGHDMAAACLAVLAGILVLGASLGGSRRRGTRERRRWPAAPADPPPSPPPIALGVSRT